MPLKRCLPLPLPLLPLLPLPLLPLPLLLLPLLPLPLLLLPLLPLPLLPLLLLPLLPLPLLPLLLLLLLLPLGLTVGAAAGCDLLIFNCPRSKSKDRSLRQLLRGRLVSRGCLRYRSAARRYHLHTHARRCQIHSCLIQMAFERQVERPRHFPLLDRCRLEPGAQDRVA